MRQILTGRAHRSSQKNQRTWIGGICLKQQEACGDQAWLKERCGKFSHLLHTLLTCHRSCDGNVADRGCIASIRVLQSPCSCPACEPASFLTWKCTQWMLLKNKPDECMKSWGWYQLLLVQRASLSHWVHLPSLHFAGHVSVPHFQTNDDSDACVWVADFFPFQQFIAN